MRFNSIGFQLFIFSALIILLSAAAVGILGYRQAYNTIVIEAQQHVLSVAYEREARLRAWLEQRRKAIEALVLSSLSDDEYYIKLDVDAMTGCLKQIRSFEGVLDLAVFDGQGRIIYPGKTGGSWDDDLNCFFMHAKSDTSSGYCAVHLNHDRNPVMSLYIPILNDDRNSLIGYVLIEQAASETINPIMTDSTSLGSSGETFLVDKEMVMLTPSRSRSHPAPLTHKMPIPPVIAALQNDSGVMFYRNFLGNDVVGAYIAMPAYGWIVITELSATEALAGLKMIVINSLSAAALALVIMLGLALLLARRLTRPLDNMAGASRKITSGDYSVRVPATRRKDEVGRLVENFNRMVSGLEKSREELIQYHERLTQSEKLAAIGQLAASVVHEMRSPLSSIKMNIQLLDRDAEADSVEAKHLELAGREIKRLEIMLQELLDYSKPITLELKSVRLSDLLDASVEQTRTFAEEHQVQVEVIKDDTWGEAEIDFEQMLRALVNLINNSITASDSGQIVTLRYSQQDDDHLSIEVTDAGKGMNERVLSRVFDPFFTTRDDGIGLGMNNVKKVIEAHHGEISVASELEQGTIVTILLPIRDEHGQAISH